MKTTLDSIQTRESQYVLHTYRRQPVAFVRGEGPRLYDVDGREYLDFVSGIGVASLGHAHPGLAAAVADQARKSSASRSGESGRFRSMPVISAPKPGLISLTCIACAPFVLPGRGYYNFAVA